MLLLLFLLLFVAFDLCFLENEACFGGAHAIKTGVPGDHSVGLPIIFNDAWAYTAKPAMLYENMNY